MLGCGVIQDGDAFGDILRYLRGGADFLSGLLLVHNNNNNNNNNSSPSRGSSYNALLGHAALRASSSTSGNNSNSNSNSSVGYGDR